MVLLFRNSLHAASQISELAQLDAESKSDPLSGMPDRDLALEQTHPQPGERSCHRDESGGLPQFPWTSIQVNLSDGLRRWQACCLLRQQRQPRRQRPDRFRLRSKSPAITFIACRKLKTKRPERAGLLITLRPATRVKCTPNQPTAASWMSTATLRGHLQRLGSPQNSTSTRRSA